MTQPSTLRFAVTAFDSWAAVHEVVRDLGPGNKSHQDISYLGLLRVMVGADGIYAPALREFSFPGNAGLVGCTPGPLAERLSGRLQSGAKSLRAALAHWLIDRHAAELAQAVDWGKITVWIRLLNDADERRAYRGLLARSANSVGVHDLVGT